MIAIGRLRVVTAVLGVTLTSPYIRVVSREAAQSQQQTSERGEPQRTGMVAISFRISETVEPPRLRNP